MVLGVKRPKKLIHGLRFLEFYQKYSKKPVFENLARKMVKKMPKLSKTPKRANSAISRHSSSERAHNLGLEKLCFSDIPYDLKPKSCSGELCIRRKNSQVKSSPYFIKLQTFYFHFLSTKISPIIVQQPRGSRQQATNKIRQFSSLKSARFFLVVAYWTTK